MRSLASSLRYSSRVTREALVIDVRGSAPIAVGGSLTLSEDGSMSGTVGGGHMEFTVLRQLHTQDAGQERTRLEFVLGGDGDQCCGGRATVAMVTVPPFLSELYQPGAARAYALAEHGQLHLVAGITRSGNRLGEPQTWGLLETSRYPGFSMDGCFFLVPALKQQPLWIFGAGHVGRAFAHLSAGLDFEVTVFDDRPEWADSRAFPEPVCLNNHCAPESLPDSPDAGIVLVMTYSHALDYALLEHFLPKPLVYLGVIASRSKSARFQHKLIRAGQQMPSHLHMPMGLSGMGKKPPEIAVSILAELLLLRHKAKGDDA